YWKKCPSFILGFTLFCNNHRVGLAESSHRDMKFYRVLHLNQGTTVSLYYHSWYWIPASMPVWRRGLKCLANQVIF
ncbi:MAG: hypothetical protein QX196_14470, partial [Methylococcaceae bacterium]